MATSSILLPEAQRASGSGQKAAPERGWGVLTAVGAGLAAIGALDLGLTVLPLRFGVAEWEFGTVTTLLNALPVVTLGLGLVLAGGLARGARLTTRTTSVVLVLLTVAVVAAALLYATNLPFILRTAAQPEFAEGLRKSMLKTGMQTLLYPTLYLSLAVYGWRHSGRRR